MGFIFIIPIATLAGWSIFSIFRWLRGDGFGPEWLRSYVILCMVGVVVGIFFAFFSQYKVANTRMRGFPIPVEFSIRENPDGPWKMSDIPVAVRYGSMAADLLSGVALCLLPLAVAAFIKQNRGAKAFAGPNAS